MSFQKVRLCDVIFCVVWCLSICTFVHASVISRTCTLHGRCVKVTDIAQYIPLCHPPFYESVKWCSLSCTAQFQKPQAAPILPLAQCQPVHSPRKRELAQLVRSLHQCAGLPWCCVCVLCLCWRMCVWVCILTWRSILPVETLLEKSWMWVHMCIVTIALVLFQCCLCHNIALIH